MQQVLFVIQYYCCPKFTHILTEITPLHDFFLLYVKIVDTKY